MRMSRFVPVVAAGALVIATVSPASAAEPGVGTTSAALEAVGLDVGDLLSVSLLTDSGLADTNPGEGGVSTAAAQLDALQVVSEALGVDQQVGLLSAESTGEQVNDSLPSASIPDNGGLVTGTLDGALSAAVLEAGALSTIGAGATDLTVLDGLVAIGEGGLDLGAGSAGSKAEGARTFSLEDLTLVELDALLAGLGMPLTDLPLEAVLGLVDALGLSAQLEPIFEALGVDSVEGLLAEVDALLAEDATLTAALESLSAEVCNPLDPALTAVGGLVGGLDGAALCAAVETSTATVTAALATVEALLGSALDDILAIVEGVGLVSLDRLQVGMSTVATDSVDTSVAEVAPVIEGLAVGGLPVPAGDAVAATEEVLATVNSQVNGVLSVVGLSDIISVSLFEQGATVTEEDGAIVSDAFFTGLGVEVTPDIAVLEGLIGGLVPADSVGAALAEAGVPVDDSVLTTINDTLGLDVVGVLGDGFSVQAASLGQNSTHVLGATATPQAPAAPAAPELPTTGSSDTLWLFVAAVAAAGALGLRRMTARSDS